MEFHRTESGKSLYLMKAIKINGIAIAIARMQNQGTKDVASCQGTVTFMLKSPQVAIIGMKLYKSKD